MSTTYETTADHFELQEINVKTNNIKESYRTTNMETNINKLAKQNDLNGVPLRPKWESIITEENDNDFESSHSDSSIIDNHNTSIIEVEHSIKSENVNGDILNQNEQKNKYKSKFLGIFTNIYCWSRCFVLLLSLILLCLSLSYCVGQLLEVKLDLITECSEPKTREEIWQHSYESSLKEKYNVNGEFILNEESHYGFTNEPCWSTRKIDINTDQLWYTNKYVYQWQKVDYRSILFGFIVLYALGIIIYNVVTMIIDMIHISTNTLHEKSKLFKQKTPKKEIRKHRTLRKIKSKYKGCISIYSKYLGSDTTGWIIQSFISEISEFVLQSQALLLFNGYHLFDPNNTNDVYLANKPEYIHLFAIIISFNCFGSGVLWLSYSLFSKNCHGLIFKLSIYFVDQFSDLLYTLFPFIIIFTDAYNQNTENILVLLGQLNITSTLAFFASFVPLFLSCNKCLFVLNNAIQEMRNIYYEKWKKTPNDNKESDITADQKKNSWLSNSNTTEKPRCNFKKLFLIVMSLFYVVFGISILLLVQKHINDSLWFCSSVTENNYFANNTILNKSLSSRESEILMRNPELFYWDKCLYKTYPFVSNDKYKCQCRVLVIDWTDLHSTAEERKQYFNLTQQKLLRGMLESWIMLEKFKTVGSEHAYYIDYILSASMFNAVHMKAFEWKQIQITSVDDGISSWRHLEYLKFEETNEISALPEDFHQLTELKYLSFIFSGIGEFDEQICNLKQLIVLQIQWDDIDSIPQCTVNLQQLKELLIDVNIQLTDVPLSIFTLPNLIDLSLFLSGFSYQSLLEYNLPQNISVNDTIATDKWFNDNFKWNDLQQTSYWLAHNPICDENVLELPPELQRFLNETDTCYYPCENDRTNNLEVSTALCIPMLFGDGRCDKACNFGTCFYDGGDCMQLCFASPELTNCSWDKYINDKCDEGCNNKYCTGTLWGSNMQRFLYTADGHNCKAEDFRNKNITQQCTNSRSIYINDSDHRIYSKCEPSWISDGFCDDACRTHECGQDAKDCELGCIDDYCHQIYQGWSIFLMVNNNEFEHKFNYTEMCDQWWHLAAHYLEIPETIDCDIACGEADYNNDGYLNFREFVSVGIQVITNNNWGKKATQVNCSSCVGMKYYDV